jgi:hypothetical protein
VRCSRFSQNATWISESEKVNWGVENTTWKVEVKVGGWKWKCTEIGILNGKSK